MVFSSLEFLFFFLPLTLITYYMAPNRLRNTVLLACSLVFYMWGAGVVVLYLLLSIFVNYLLGLIADSAKYSNEKKHLLPVAVWGSIVSNLMLLGYFKYANFFTEQFSNVLVAFGQPAMSPLNVILPIGISFFTFQSMSYVFDIVQGRSRALRNPLDFALYVALFPQLIAGPIVRFHIIQDELRKRFVSLQCLAEGSSRFIYGLCKKVIIADPAGAIAEAVFDVPTGSLSTASAWIGAIAYAVQIYFDFSAYSDMAIGLGRIFGFHFPQNFNNPYTALSITDFWRRWHMTLSNWFRDYVYIPLGGSRVSSGRVYFNLSLVFLLTGIWHGANWTFILWGVYHGILLIIERITNLRTVKPDAIFALRRLVVLVLVIIGWVLFRANSVSDAIDIYQSMFFWSGSDLAVDLQAALTHRNVLFLMLGCLIAFAPANWSGYEWLAGAYKSDNKKNVTVGSRCRAFIVFPLAFVYTLIQISADTFSPFLYFRF